MWVPKNALRLASRSGSDRPLRATEGRLVIARRSRRCRLRQGSSKSRGLVLTTWRLRGWSRRPGPRTALACPKVLRTPRRQAGNSGLSTLRPCGFNGLKLRAAEAGPISSLHRAASRRRIEAVPKSLLPRRPFGLCLGRANPRLDVWKVRLAADSGKRGTVQLSTFRQNASGQEWITQRPGALAKIRSDPAAPVGAAGGH